MKKNHPDFKPPCQLLGQDKNIFHLLGIAVRTLERHHLHEKAKEMKSLVFKAESFEDALAIMDDYVEIC